MKKVKHFLFNNPFIFIRLILISIVIVLYLILFFQGSSDSDETMTWYLYQNYSFDNNDNLRIHFDSNISKKVFLSLSVLSEGTSKVGRWVNGSLKTPSGDILYDDTWLLKPFSYPLEVYSRSIYIEKGNYELQLNIYNNSFDVKPKVAILQIYYYE